MSHHRPASELATIPQKAQLAVRARPLLLLLLLRRSSQTRLHASPPFPIAPFFMVFNNGGAFRLLEVYKKLRNIAAAISDDCTQNALLDEAKTTVLDVCNEHVFAVESFIKDPQIQAAVAQEIKDDCQELIDYVLAAKRFNLEVNARSKDRVVSFGEKLSCRFMAAMLKDRVGFLHGRWSRAHDEALEEREGELWLICGAACRGGVRRPVRRDALR